MPSLLRHIAVALGAILFCATYAAAEKRVALVIGNGAYQRTERLPNPKNDAEDVSAALRRTGFETITGLDLDKAGMEDATIRFARAAREADIAIFYYSGHALQFNGVNYLMPVDAKLNDEADLRRMARVDEIVADVQQAKNLRILVLDSCRDNPLAEQLKRRIGTTRSASIGRGLARIDSPQGMILAFSTQAGSTAADGTGRNSPYTAAFLKHIEAAEEIGTVFRRVSADVYEATRRAQLPELSLSLIGEFYLKGRAVAVPQAAPDVSALQERLKALEEQLRKKDEPKKEEPKVAVVAPPVAPAAPTETQPKPAVGVFPPSTIKVTPLSPERERSLKPKDTFKECDLCPEMVVVPAGSFTMGSPEKEKDRRSSEGPQRRVTFAKPFAAGKFEVTVDQFAVFVKDTGYVGGSCWTFEDGKFEERSDRSFRNPGFTQAGSHPATCLNSDDANSYIDWLSRMTDQRYRLLTEAEWEYAARAGTTTRFYFGDNSNGLCAYGNGADRMAKRSVPGGARLWNIAECEDRFAYTAPVGSFLPNAFGLHDMHGNVWEWTEDCWNPTYAGAPTDGSAWTVSDDCRFRVLRGGSWGESPRSHRSANRLWPTTGFRLSHYGFRVARSLD